MHYLLTYFKNIIWNHVRHQFSQLHDTAFISDWFVHVLGFLRFRGGEEY